MLNGLVRRVREAAKGAVADANRSEHPRTRSKSMAARKSRSKEKAARPTTVAAYLASLTPEKRTVIEEARAFVLKHIPKGYAEFMNWGRDQLGDPARRVLQHAQRSAALLRGPRRAEELQLALPDGHLRQLERQVHIAVLRKASRRRIQESREAARHGEVLSALQGAR